MLLKEFLEFIRPAQRIVINKGSFQCRYQMQNDRSDKFYNFIICSSMYENLDNKTIEGILLESKIQEITSSLVFEEGRSPDSALIIDLEFISVQRLIRSLIEKAKEDKDDEVRFSIYNKYKIVSENVVSTSLNTAEVMFYNKDDSGKYNIFIDCDLEESNCTTNQNLHDNVNTGISSLPPNLSGENPHLRSASKAFENLYKTSTEE